MRAKTVFWANVYFAMYGLLFAAALVILLFFNGSHVAGTGFLLLFPATQGSKVIRVVYGIRGLGIAVLLQSLTLCAWPLSVFLDPNESAGIWFTLIFGPIGVLMVGFGVYLVVFGRFRLAGSQRPMSYALSALTFPLSRQVREVRAPLQGAGSALLSLSPGSATPRYFL